MTREIPAPPRAVRIAVVAIVIAPIAVAVARALRRHWFPIGDDALLYLRSVDVLTAHHPLLGSWTSASLIVGEHMNNPGPLHADLVAPFAKLFSPGPGAAIGMGVLNSAAVVGIAIAARHVGGWAMERWMILAAAALTWTMGSELLIDIWQAHAMLLPFLLYLVLLVGIAAGRRRCVVWAVAVASLLVQTHVSYAYAVVLFTAVTVALWWWRERPRADRRLATRLWRVGRVPLAVAFLLWAQSLWEQLFGPGRGNLGRLLANSSGGDVTIGFEQAVQITGAVVALPPWWLRSGFSSSVPGTRLTGTGTAARLDIPGLPHVAVAALAIAVLVAVLVVVAVRTTDPVLRCAAALAAAASILAVVCLALVSVGAVGLAPHHVRWMWTLAVFVDVVAIWGVVDLVAASARWVTPAVVAATVVAAIANVPYQAHPQGPVDDYWAMPALREAFRRLEPLEAADPVLYDVSNLRVFEPYSSAVMMRMQELDIEFRVTDEVLVRQLGPRRRADGDETVRLFQLEDDEARTYAGPACRLVLAPTVDDDGRERWFGLFAEGLTPCP